MAESDSMPIGTMAQALSMFTGIQIDDINKVFKLDEVQITKDIQDACKIWFSDEKEEAKTQNLVEIFRKLNPIDPKSAKMQSTKEGSTTKDITEEDSKPSAPESEDSTEDETTVRELTIDDYILALIEFCCTDEGRQRVITAIKDSLHHSVLDGKEIQYNFVVGGRKSQLGASITNKYNLAIIMSKNQLEERRIPVFADNCLSWIIPMPAFSLGQLFRQANQYFDADCDLFLKRPLEICRFSRMLGAYNMLVLDIIKKGADITKFFEEFQKDMERVRKIRELFATRDLTKEQGTRLESILQQIASKYFSGFQIPNDPGILLFKQVFDPEIVNIMDELKMISYKNPSILDNDLLINYSIYSYNISVLQRKESFSDGKLYKQLLKFHPEIKEKLPFDIDLETEIIPVSNNIDYENLIDLFMKLDNEQKFTFINFLNQLYTRSVSDEKLPKLKEGQIPGIVLRSAEYEEKKKDYEESAKRLFDQPYNPGLQAIVASGAVMDLLEEKFGNFDDYYLLCLDAHIDEIKEHFDSMNPPQETADPSKITNQL